MHLRQRWIVGVICLTMGVLVCFPGALAQVKKGAEKPNPDESVIHDYVLTMAKAEKYSDVSKKMKAAGKADPALSAEMQKVGDSNGYVVEKVDLMEKSPHVAAFFKSNGITARDFAFTPMTILTATLAIAVEQAKKPAPSYVNPANIKFVQDHQAELEKLNLFDAE